MLARVSGFAALSPGQLLSRRPMSGQSSSRFVQVTHLMEV